jgi:hypothetical protein
MQDQFAAEEEGGNTVSEHQTGKAETRQFSLVFGQMSAIGRT